MAIALETYRHSGRWGRLPLMTVLVGLPLMVTLAAAYSYLVVYLPIGGWITLVLVGGYAWLVGLATSILGKQSHCRSLAAMRLCGLVLGLTALVFAWLWFVQALVNRQAEPGEGVTVIDLARHPAATWEIITAVNAEGWYSIKKLTPSGIVLWVMWAIEALVVVGVPLLMAPSRIEHEAYCETCGRWSGVTETRHLEPTPQVLEQPIAEITPHQLFGLTRLGQPVLPAIRAELLECPVCKTFHGLRYARQRQVFDDKGKSSTTTEPVAGILVLPPTAGPAVA